MYFRKLELGKEDFKNKECFIRNAYLPRLYGSLFQRETLNDKILSITVYFLDKRPLTSQTSIHHQKCARLETQKNFVDEVFNSHRWCSKWFR